MILWVLGEKAIKILKHIEAGTASAVASPISLTEILFKPIKEGNPSLEKQYKLLVTAIVANADLFITNDQSIK